MSSPFRGYLIKAVATNETLDSKFIEMGTYKSNPDQREEIKAYRDDNSRDLTRVTADGEKTAFQFSTRKNMHLAEKMELQSWFYRAESNHKQRNIELEFWNDETNSYDRGVFYRPNMEFTIIRYTDDDIIYDALEIKGIEC